VLFGIPETFSEIFFVLYCFGKKSFAPLTLRS